MPRNVDFLVHQTYNWFSFSSSRQIAYKAIYTTLNNGALPLKIMAPSGTRWLSVHQCVERILCQWDELKLHFQLAKSSEKCYTADLLYQMYADPMNKLFLEFLKPVLSDFNRINKLFQSESVSCSKLFSDLNLFHSDLVRRTVKQSVIQKTKNIMDIDFRNDSVYIEAMNVDLGAIFKLKIEEAKLTPGQRAELLHRCSKFLRESCRQVAKRLPDNLKMLSAMYVLSAKTATSAVKPPVTELPFIQSQFKGDLERLETEWRQVG